VVTSKIKTQNSDKKLKISSDEQVEATYTGMYEGIANCLNERKLVR